jgi:hypothetical protein
MRAVALMMLLGLVGGCDKVNRCKDGTVLLSFSLTGAAASADRFLLATAIDDGPAKTADVPVAGMPNGTVEIDFPRGYPKGQRLSVTLTAKQGDATVGTGGATTTLDAACATLGVTVIGEPSQEPDLAPPGPPGPVTLMVTGATTVSELDTLHLNIAAVDPTGMPVTVEISGLPAAASTTIDGSAASGTVDWTTAYKDRGQYNLTLKANAADPSRSLTQMVTLTVLRGIDPVPGFDAGVGGPPFMHAIGDFDKDGFGDLAACVADKTAQEYRIHVLFGDKDGVSATPTIKAWHYQQFNNAIQIADTGFGLSCVGGDFNRDGFGDVALGDPNNVAGGTNAGLMFMALGETRATSNARINNLVDSTGRTGLRLGGPGTGVLAGDFNGDSIDDLATSMIPPLNPSATTADKWLDLWLGPTPTTTPTNFNSKVIDYSDNTKCYSTQLIAAGKVNGDAAADLLVWNNAIAGTAGTCSPAPFGGVRLVFGDSGNSFANARNIVGWGNGFGQSSTLCDVDNDGRDDLVVLYRKIGSGGGDGNVYFFLNDGTPTAFPGGLPMGPGIPMLAGPTDGTYEDVGCARNFLGKRSTVLLSHSRPNGVGSLDVVVGGGPMPPVVTRSFANPMPQTTDHYMSYVPQGTTTDLDADGKQDLLVLSSSRKLGNENRYWVIYGR